MFLLIARFFLYSFIFRFHILDFYLFNSVRAKTKMRKKGWTGIWGREDASKLYLKINTAVFGIERKTYNVSI